MLRSTLISSLSRPSTTGGQTNGDSEQIRLRFQSKEHLLRLLFGLPPHRLRSLRMRFLVEKIRQRKTTGRTGSIDRRAQFDRIEAKIRARITKKQDTSGRWPTKCWFARGRMCRDKRDAGNSIRRVIETKAKMNGSGGCVHRRKTTLRADRDLFH